MTLPFDYGTPILSGIQVFSIQMVTVFVLAPRKRTRTNVCELFFLACDARMCNLSSFLQMFHNTHFFSLVFSGNNIRRISQHLMHGCPQKCFQEEGGKDPKSHQKEPKVTKSQEKILKILLPPVDALA